MRKNGILWVALLLCVTGTINAQNDSDTDFSKWQFRLRGIAVAPDESADIEVIGGDASISTAFVPEFDISY
ncbi:MAG: hypothetical protein AAGH46_13720, partial [Bacteroidota bacterium]